MTYRIGLIGAGRFAPFHIGAIRATGLNLNSISASLNSIRAEAVAKKFDINNFYKSTAHLIDSDTWDGLVIASTVQTLTENLILALPKGKPILIEKPVSLFSSTLLDVGINHDNVLVGYNRRFYEHVNYLKQCLSKLGPSIVNVQIPERLDFKLDELDLHPVKSNSVHVIDLLHFLFGKLYLKSVNHLNSKGTIAILQSSSGDIINLTLNYNSPANFSITIDNAPYRYRLKPLEILTTFEGMEIDEPSPNNPIRTYRPKIISQMYSDSTDNNLKPGFLKQYQEFKKLLEGKPMSIGATLEDAYHALNLAEKMTADFNS